MVSVDKRTGKLIRFPKGNKYGAVRTRCHQGHSHPSKGEALKCDEIYLVLNSGSNNWVAVHYERKYELVVNKHLVGTHKPDWTIEHKDGSISIIEFKGAETRDWKLRKKLFMALYPDIPYTVLKRR